MAHLIGYVGEVSEDMLNSPKFELYERGDIVGQSGVELQYNDLLMGKDGSRRVLRNKQRQRSWASSECKYSRGARPEIKAHSRY